MDPRRRRKTIGQAHASQVVSMEESRDESLAKRASSGSITDAEGLRRAYEQGDAYTHGKTLYVAGSHTARDWMDDITRIPFWRPLFGGSKAIHRYQMAQQAARETKPDIVVGHSLGGAVALQMQKEQPGLKTRTDVLLSSIRLAEAPAIGTAAALILYLYLIGARRAPWTHRQPTFRAFTATTRRPVETRPREMPRWSHRRARL